MFDGCMSAPEDKEDAICNMIASYEEECINAGHKVEGWRTQDFCRKCECHQFKL